MRDIGTKSILIYVLVFANFLCEANSFRFNHITSSNGISQSEVYSFLEDSKGFVWFGTVDGLNRYDGYEIKIFNTDRNDPHSLSNNTIRSLAEDKFGRIWIGTDDGLNYYDPETEKINKVKVGTSNEKFTVWSMLALKDQLLVGTNDGLWRTTITDRSSGDIEKEFIKINRLSTRINTVNQVRTIAVSKHGGIWIQTANQISRIIFESNDKEPVIVEDLTFEGFSNQIQAVEDSNGCLWIVSDKNGLLLYNPAKKEYRHVSREESLFASYSKKCSALAIDKEGSMWIGTLDKGLLYLKYDFQNDKIKHIESIQYEPDNFNSLNSNLIYSLYFSGSNKLFVGTIGSGINIYNPEQKKFQHYKIKNTSDDLYNSNFIRSVFVDNNNRIWTGTHNNGLFLLDRKKNSFRKLAFETQSVFYIESYQDDKYFICSDNGIFLVRLVGEELKILSKGDLVDNSAVFYVVKGNSDIYWAATLNGLVRMRILNNQIVVDKIYTNNTNPGISTNNCRVLFFDKARNQLLVGTEGGGINYILLDDNSYPKEIKVYKKANETNSLSNNYIRSILQDDKKNIWIGTYEGLNKEVFDTNSGIRSFKSYTKNDGLPDNMIEFIVEDESHFLWIGTNGGLSKFSQLDGSFINYNMNDGLQSNEFSEHTVYRTPGGEIVMGGINGINAFYPRDINICSLNPRVTITDFYLNNKRIVAGEKVGKNTPLEKSITMTDTLELSPKLMNIGFQFTAMLYPNAEKIQYAYMLQGFDEDWILADANNRKVNYTNLRHGKYIFKVKSTNTDGVWDNKPEEIFIHIQTPFIYTWFAYMLYLITLMMLLLYFSHFTIIRYTTKKKLLLEKEHIEKLHKLDEMRTRFFINISHDLRTPLTLISGPLDNILKENKIDNESKEELLLIKRNVKRLKYLVEQLLDVRKAESGTLYPKVQCLDITAFTNVELGHFSYAIKKKGIELKHLNSNEKILACFDPEMLSKVYFNVISNAIKYTKTGNISIFIKETSRSEFSILKSGMHDTYVGVEIKDTGTGISKDQQQHVFERFYQDKKKTDKGYGIGLSHTKELIEAHQGFIEVESEENVGTTLRFFLPDLEDKDMLVKNNEVSTEDIYIQNNTDGETIEDEINETVKTVLVAEDNLDMLTYIKNGLKGAFNVILANDGKEALELALRKTPDLIVSDVMMPNMDGIEFCEKIKSNIKTSHIPVILLTAKVDQETKYEGIETGADDFIPKPFEMEYLIIRINNLLQSRENLRKIFQNNVNLEPSVVTVNSIDERFLTSLMDAIEENITDENFSINSLESKLGMSHSSFYRKIKCLTGQSGQELLQNIRMKRAYQILSDKKGLRVAEVAYMVGFTNPKYFSKCFKEMFGYAPSELKNTDE